jgi:hypothetical protein
MGEAQEDERIAECGCGRVKVCVRGAPQVVAVCHCDFCQKHTGSAFRVSSFFRDDQILEITGDAKVYNGLEIDGVGLDGSEEYGTAFHFCGTCGSTVYWVTDLLPGFHGISVGSFVDPSFPTPTMEVWTELRHHWVVPIPDAVAFERFASS